jgi:hypothetical protein
LDFLLLSELDAIPLESLENKVEDKYGNRCIFKFQEIIQEYYMCNGEHENNIDTSV